MKSEFERHRILLVEDDESTLTSLTLLFELEGFEVIGAKDGLEGHAKATSPGPFPDVILTDIDTPNLNGLDFIRLIKADPLVHHIPVIVMTASNRDVLSTACALGAVACYQKPFDFEELLCNIRRILDEGPGKG